MENVNAIKAALTAVIGVLSALWGWFGWLVVAWGTLVGLDYFTGYGAALKNGEWSSDKAREGVWHKLGCLITVIVAAVLDAVVGYLLGNITALQLPFDYSVFFAPLVVTWYLLMEMGSILENVGRMGAPLPKFLEKAIAVLRNTVDNVGDSATGGTEKDREE